MFSSPYRASTLSSALRTVASRSRKLKRPGRQRAYALVLAEYQRKAGMAASLGMAYDIPGPPGMSNQGHRLAYFRNLVDGLI